MNVKSLPSYRDILVAAANNEGERLPHWALARAHFEEAINEICEQEKQDWWRQLDDDAEAGLLEDWTET
jgi:hypothetical protein